MQRKSRAECRTGLRPLPGRRTAKGAFWYVPILILAFLLASSAVGAVRAYTELATVNANASPYGIAYDSGKGEVFVANNGQQAGEITRIFDNNDTVGGEVQVCRGPTQVAYDSGRGEVFVSCSGESLGLVGVVNDSDFLGSYFSIQVGHGPTGMAYDAAKGEVFVANSGNSSVSVISDKSDSVVATIPVAEFPYGVAYDPVEGEVFVASCGNSCGSGNSTVSVISDGNDSVVHKVPIDPGAGMAAYDSGKGETFVQTYAGVAVISDSKLKVVATIPLATADSDSMAYDAAKGEVFTVVDSGVWAVSDSTDSVINQIPSGSSPYGVAYDSGQGEIFVSNTGDGTLSVVSDVPVTMTTTVGPPPTTTGYATGTSTPGASSSIEGVSVPEYPFQAAAVVAFAVLLAVSYLLLRARSSPGASA